MNYLVVKRVIRYCIPGLFLLAAGTARSTTVADYQQRIAKAERAIAQLQTPEYYADNASQRDSFVRATLARVRSLLPAKETVLCQGQNVEVDNRWLYAALNEYEKDGDDHARAADVLKGILERLRALAESLDDERAGGANSGKDDSKARLAEILRRPEYDKSAAQGSALERLWERFIRWLMSLFPKSKPLQPGTTRAVSTVAQIVVVIVSLGLIGFIVWKFGPRFLRNRGKRKKEKREARIVLGERLEPDQTAADLLAQAESLARTGNLRAAIRKAYIALLCELGDRKIISLAQYKTNRDYLNSLRDKASLYASMSKLTSSFELHWYGFVPANENDWNEFRAAYKSTLRA